MHKNIPGVETRYFVIPYLVIIWNFNRIRATEMPQKSRFLVIFQFESLISVYSQARAPDWYQLISLLLNRIRLIDFNVSNNWSLHLRIFMTSQMTWRKNEINFSLQLDFILGSCI